MQTGGRRRAGPRSGRRAAPRTQRGRATARGSRGSRRRRRGRPRSSTREDDRVRERRRGEDDHPEPRQRVEVRELPAAPTRPGPAARATRGAGPCSRGRGRRSSRPSRRRGASSAGTAPTRRPSRIVCAQRTSGSTNAPTSADPRTGIPGQIGPPGRIGLAVWPGTARARAARARAARTSAARTSAARTKAARSGATYGARRRTPRPPRARSGIGSLLAWTTPSGQEVSAPSGPRPTRRGRADDHAKVGRWAATVVSFRRAAGCPTMYT